MITILDSKLQYKATDGGVTKRIPEHFVKRSVRFENDGEERRIDINKTALPISATEEDLNSYIVANIDESTATQKQVETLQEDLNNAIMELSMVIAMGGSN